MSATPFAPDAVLEAARQRRFEILERGKRRSVALASTVVVCWALAVTATGQWQRIAGNLSATITMVFGSFVAGSTPQGGGAVAFPVFTKILGVSAPDAATFSLSIQAIGMGTATAIIGLTGRAIDRGALRLTVPSAVVGYLSGSILFRTLTLPATYTKVIFTLVVLAAGMSTVRIGRSPLVEQLRAAPLRSATTRRAVIVVAGIGGMASALVGSGADVAVYLLLTIVLGVRPSIGVATSVVTMAAVSVVGLAVSWTTGDLSPALTAEQVDLFGMWLAAIPVVVIGAPAGSWFASRVSPSILTGLIAGLAGLEVVSTTLFLPELRTDALLAGFAVVGLAATVGGVQQLLVLRNRIAIARTPACASVRRLDLEIGAPS